MVAFAARRDAALVDHDLAGIAAGIGGGLERHRGELLGVLREIGDVELVERLGRQCLDRDRHALQRFRALGRGDDDVAAIDDRLGGGGRLRGRRGLRERGTDAGDRR